MDRLYNTVEKFIGHLEKVSKKFLVTDGEEHILDAIYDSAMTHIYNPRRFKPKMYRWTFRFINWQYYRTRVTDETNVISERAIRANTYSIHPNVRSIVDGKPYKYDFVYNGKPRPFIRDAEKALIKGDKLKQLREKAVDFYKRNGFDAKLT